MLDNVLGTLRRGVERARTRGEEVAQTTRLRFEIFQLGRELDALYGRLGRAYHSGADVAILQPIRDEIARVDEEIAAREQLIREIAATEHGPVDDTAPTAAAPSPGGAVPVASSATTVRNDSAEGAPATATPGVSPQPVVTEAPVAPALVTPASPPRPSTNLDESGLVEGNTPAAITGTPGVPSAASVFSTMQTERRDPTPPTPGATMSDNRRVDEMSDQPNSDYQDRVDEGQTVSRGTKTDADLHGSSAPIPPLGTLAGNDDNIARAPVAPNTDTEKEHERLLRKQESIEADRASRDPDPLD